MHKSKTAVKQADLILGTKLMKALRYLHKMCPLICFICNQFKDYGREKYGKEIDRKVDRKRETLIFVCQIVDYERLWCVKGSCVDLKKK